jgi:hypothetical protein
MFLGNFCECAYGATTATVLQQFLFSCRRDAIQGTGKFELFVKILRLNWHRSAIFQHQYDFSSATW